jgi:hypothetical protein
MILAAWLLALLAAVNLLPEALSVSLGHSVRAWEYVLEGALVSCLLLIIAWLAAPKCETSGHRRITFLVLAYGLFEAAQRPICRLAFPMDRAPPLADGQYLCDAAGLRTSELSVLFVAVIGLAAALSERHHERPTAKSC